VVSRSLPSVEASRQGILDRHDRREDAVRHLRLSTKLHRLDENIAAASIQLGASDLAEIERLAASVAIQGERYSESSQRMIDR